MTGSLASFKVVFPYNSYQELIDNGTYNVTTIGGTSFQDRMVVSIHLL